MIIKNEMKLYLSTFLQNWKYVFPNFAYYCIKFNISNLYVTFVSTTNQMHLNKYTSKICYIFTIFRCIKQFTSAMTT